jgi:hypothetical protein
VIGHEKCEGALNDRRDVVAAGRTGDGHPLDHDASNGCAMLATNDLSLERPLDLLNQACGVCLIEVAGEVFSNRDHGGPQYPFRTRPGGAAAFAYGFGGALTKGGAFSTASISSAA